MSFHKTTATRNMRTPHAHLERNEQGEIYGVYKLAFSHDAPRFVFCFIGSEAGVLRYNENVIAKHPNFKSISKFESWCMKYTAEHDLK